MSAYTSATEVSSIYGKNQFNQLDEKEKNYSYYFTRASIQGAKICLFEVSREAPAIFALLHLAFSAQPISQLKERYLAVSTQENWDSAIRYSGAFFGQLGNYKSFGSTKFIPGVSSEQFYKLLALSDSYKDQSALIDELWNSVKDVIYKNSGEYEKIDLYPQGLTGYYSPSLKKQDIEKADKLLDSLHISPLNTHIYKKDNIVYIKVCSINQSQTQHQFEGQNYIVQYGFLAPFLQRTVDNLQSILPYVSNQTQKLMIEAYIKHFQTGSIQDHKQSQRHWVKDIGPVVETNLGHVETYLDPIQVRAYWEGMVAVVDKKASQIVGHLVANAENLLEKFAAWPKQFQKDKFLKPDFTALSILTFASFDTPRGINIPNYDDIRGQIGFKNVFLANNVVIPTKLPKYINQANGQLLIKYFNQVAFHSVSYHELLGHGCGKLLTETEGAFNFNHQETINPITNEVVKTWYKDGQTWSGKFKALSNPYEECRADSVALYYSAFEEAVLLLQPQLKENWINLRNAVWTSFVNMGVNSLQFYNQKDARWMQAHSNGRFVILQVLLEAGNDFVKVQKIEKDGKPWILASIDHSKIQQIGLPALKNFLLKLNVFKATADLENATKMYQGYSEVNNHFQEIKSIIEANKSERHLQIQGNIIQKSPNVFEYVEYPLTFQGLIQQAIEAHPKFDQELIDLWRDLQTYQ